MAPSPAHTSSQHAPEQHIVPELLLEPNSGSEPVAGSV